jgi:Bacterial PH domain
VSSDQAVQPGESKMFRLPGAVVAWWAWVIFAVANLIDLAVQGRGHTAVEIAVALAGITGVVYACALRPRIVADPGGITVMNPLRDHRVPWGSVTGVDLAESVQVHYAAEADPTRGKVVHSWALYARRSNRLRSELIQQGRGRRLPRSSPDSYGQPAGDAEAIAKQSAAKIMAMQLDQMARDARARGAAAGPLVVSWAWSAIAAIVVPAVALALVVALLCAGALAQRRDVVVRRTGDLGRVGHDAQVAGGG